MSDVRGPLIEPRPQPIGVFPPPAGYLLVPPVEEGDEALSRLLRGDATGAMPAQWRFFGLAVAGDTDAALAELAGRTDAFGAYNRFVLRPDEQTLDRLLAELEGDWHELLQVVGFALGFLEELPQTDNLTGELAALAASARAAEAIEQGEPGRAIAVLDHAIAAARSVSPLSAAQLLAQRADVSRQLDAGALPQAIAALREAIQLAGDTPLPPLRAALWFQLGATLQEQADGRRDLLLESVRAYQECLRSGISAEHSRELYAQTHSNLALAYLAMPASGSSDTPRMGIAVQSLREALSIFQRETHPDQWASTQLNLANALQYLPSAHPQENLIQAVELYEEILKVRHKALDPLGYARLLANQANALAHLGIFSPALEKLDEAHKLFHWHGEPDLAATTLQLAGQIHERLGREPAAYAAE